MDIFFLQRPAKVFIQRYEQHKFNCFLGSFVFLFRKFRRFEVDETHCIILFWTIFSWSTGSMKGVQFLLEKIVHRFLVWTWFQKSPKFQHGWLFLAKFISDLKDASLKTQNAKTNIEHPTYIARSFFLLSWRNFSTVIYRSTTLSA